VSSSDQDFIDDLLAGLIAQRLAGEQPDLDAILAAHPEHAEEIRIRYADLERLSMLWREGPAAGFAENAKPGTCIGEYEIEREIGRGGMGIVYLASQRDLGRQVALKVIPPATLSAITRQRFLREAKALASLSHPNIVPIFTAGDESGSLFIAMEYVPGASLSTLISQVRHRPAGIKAHQAWEDCLQAITRSVDEDQTERNEPRADESCHLDDRYVRNCVSMVVQIAGALMRAHETGVIHRDVKPGNIIISNDGRARLLDFGLAAVHTEPHVTVSGEFFGTPYYVAPEQAAGRSAQVGPASDVYSLGATLYECLTLQPPFDAESIPEILAHVLNDDAKPARQLNPTLPRDLETILAKSLSKSLADRYESMEDLADDLTRFLEGRPIRAKRATAVQRVVKWSRRRPVTASLLVLLLTIFFAGVGVWSWQLAETRKAQSQTQYVQTQLQHANREVEVSGVALQAETANAERWRYVRIMADADRQWLAGDVDAIRGLLRDAPAQWRNWEWSMLSWRCNSELQSLPRGTAATHIAWRRDGQGVAVSSNAGDIQLWDLTSTQRTHTMMPVVGYSGGVDYLDDGKRVVSACADGIVRVWDTATGQELRSFSGVPDGIGNTSQPITDMAVSPDERYLLTVGGVLNSGGWARLHELPTGRLYRSYSGHQSTINAVAYSTDGKHFATAARDGTAHVWDVSSESPLLTLRGHGEGRSFIYDVAFSPTGGLLATCGEEGIIQLWDSKSGEIVRTMDFGSTAIRAVAFSPDGKLLAGVGVDGAAPVYDVSNGKKVTVFQGHPPLSLSVAFSPDGKRLATGGQRSVKIWDVATRQEGIPLRSPARSLALAENEIIVAGLSPRGELQVYSVEDRKILRTLGSPTDQVIDVVSHPKRANLAAAVGWESGVTVWDVATGAQKLVIKPSTDYRYTGRKPAVSPTALAFSPSATTFSPNSVAFSPDGNLLAVGISRVWTATDRPLAVVQVYDAEAGTLLKSLPFPEAEGIVDISFAPDGRHIAAASPYLLTEAGQTPGGVAIWSWPSGDHLRTFRQQDGGGLYSLAISADGRYLAMGTNEGGIRVVDLETNHELTSLRGHKYSVSSMAFSPDSSRLVSAGRSVLLWDLLTGQSVMTLARDTGGYDQRFQSVAFSSDGSTIVAGGENCPMLIWCVPTTMDKQ